MAGKGMPPDPAGRRARARMPIRIAADGKLRGPALPPRNPMGDGTAEWHPRTRKWWTAWRKSPQAIRFVTGPDWDFLLDTALIYDQLMKTGDLRFMAELRLREAQLGATPADRARLNVEVGVVTEGPLAPGQGATVSSMDDIRDRLREGMTESRRQRIIEQGNDSNA